MLNAIAYLSGGLLSKPSLSCHVTVMSPLVVSPSASQAIDISYGVCVGTWSASTTPGISNDSIRVIAACLNNITL